MNETEKSYFQTLEEGVAKLSQVQRAEVYRQCAVNCVQNTVLPVLRKRYNECGGNLDLFFSSKYDSEYSFQRVVEQGRTYEFGYPKCFCPLHFSGFATAASHCECSRQSILFILGKLFVDKKFQVKIINTVLNGASKCSFTIEVL